MLHKCQNKDSSLLLESLKDVVKKWVVNNYDSSLFDLIVECILNILVHGLKQVETNGYNREFINDLFWLNPTTTFLFDQGDHIPVVDNEKKFSQVLSSWVIEKLQEPSLCSHLELLISNKQMMDIYYNTEAVLRDENISAAYLTCILVVELKKPVLLSLISENVPTLFNQSNKISLKRAVSYDSQAIESKRNNFLNENRVQYVNKKEINSPNNKNIHLLKFGRSKSNRDISQSISNINVNASPTLVCESKTELKKNQISCKENSPNIFLSHSISETLESSQIFCGEGAIKKQLKTNVQQQDNNACKYIENLHSTNTLENKFNGEKNFFCNYNTSLKTNDVEKQCPIPQTNKKSIDLINSNLTTITAVCRMKNENSPTLLLYLKKSIESWFHKIDKSSKNYVIEAILCVLVNGFHDEKGFEFYQDFINNIFWLNTYSIHHLSIPCEVTDENSFFQILYFWIDCKLEESSLCSCFELLISDKELMDVYYMENAFLRDEIYSHAFLTCMSAIELREPILLSIISPSLYIPVNESKTFRLRHRRTGSHPQFSLPRNFTGNKECLLKLSNSKSYFEEKEEKSIENCKFHKITVRKYKSLPNINFVVHQRPRSHTISQAMAITQDNSMELHSKLKSDSISKILNNEPDTQFCSQASLLLQSFPNSSLAVSEMSSIQNQIKISAEKFNDQLISRSAPQIVRKKIRKNCIDEHIQIYFDRNHPQSSQSDNSSGPGTSNSNTIVDCNSPISSYNSNASVKGLSPINFLSCLSKQIFSSRSDPISIGSRESFSLNSNSSSVAGSLSKSFKASDVLNSLVGTREGQKLVKMHSNLFDDVPCPNTKTISSSKSVSWNNSNKRCSKLRKDKDGQSFSSLMQSPSVFNTNHTDLERENAHFKISEAVISAIERIKWTKDELAVNKKTPNNIALQIGGNTNLNLSKKVEENHIFEQKFDGLPNDIIQVVENATSYLDPKENSSAPSTAESANEDREYDDLLDSYDNILPEHIAFAEWGNAGFDNLSAESVGLSLISKFNDVDLPRVSELKWLVSEEICARYNVPQELLPIPDLNGSENPDDHIVHHLQRGTRDWAPPRKQIIFTDYQSTMRKEQMIKQNYRCAGCGMRVAPAYSNRFRFCYYLGKYLCTGCHRNHRSIIPAKVFRKWDFTLYPVCVFSYRLIEEIWHYPLFQLSDLAPALYKRIRSLGLAKFYREQLKFLKDFITTCRFSQSEEKLFYEIQTYITSDPDKWSMSDFIDTKQGILQKNLKVIIDKCDKHVKNCVLCRARGFICEVCYNDEPVFPWQLKIQRCNKCGVCYHTKCYKKLVTEGCRKCNRLVKKAYREKLLLIESVSRNHERIDKRD